MSDFLSQLELSVRARNVLRNLDIGDLESFMELTQEEILAVRNAGRQTWHEIRELQDYFSQPQRRPWSRRDEIALALLPVVYTKMSGVMLSSVNFEENCAKRAFAMADAFLAVRSDAS